MNEESRAAIAAVLRSMSTSELVATIAHWNVAHPYRERLRLAGVHTVMNYADVCAELDSRIPSPKP